MDIDVVVGDLTKMPVEAIVNAANNELWMGGGVAGAIKTAGGVEIELEAMAQGPIEPGSAVATSAGRLPPPTRWVIHAATMPAATLVTDEVLIRSATRSALKRADEIGAKSVALPALGTGVGGFPIERAARVMAEEAVAFGRTAQSVGRVVFVVRNEEARHAFVEFGDSGFVNARVTSRLVRFLDIAAPPRLGRSFRWLLGTSVVNNFGDGVALAAGPLLIASQTRDPFLVSMAVFSSWLPNLLLSVPAGAIADRFDRRKIMAAVNLLRAAVLTVLGLTIVSGAVTIWLVLLSLFLMGFAETFADVAASSLLPRVVPEKKDLGIANARLQGSVLLTNQLVAPPIGAFMFAFGMAVPFGVNAACFALGAVLIFRVVLSAPTEQAPTQRRHLVAEMADGVRWLMAHPPMRTLALTILAFNVTFGAAWSVLVLYAQDRLGMTDVGFGLLTTALAVGGFIGIAIYGSLERRFRLANIMRVGLID